MPSPIGGRLEAVPPKRSLFGPDYARLVALFVISAAVHAWLLTHTVLTARDTMTFARQALNMAYPPGASDPPDPSRTVVELMKDKDRATHPPGFPLALLAAGKVVKLVTDLPTPDALLRGAQLANAIAGVLLVIPAYLLGRMLFGRSAGFAAALLTQVLPVFAQVTSDGLSEGVYLLTMTTALTLGVRAVRRPGIGWFLLTGMATGAAYLVRPEGLLPAAAVGLVGVGLGLAGRWPWAAAAGRLTALAVGVGLVGGPYVALIGGLTNKTTGRQLLNPSDAPAGPIWLGQPPTSAAPSVGGPLFAIWWDERVDAGKNRLLWSVTGVAKETAKTAHYGPFVLGLLGMVLFRRRLASDPGLTLLAVLAGLYAVVLVRLGTHATYLSERHTIVISMILCVFAAGALEPVVAALARLPVVGRLWAGPYAATGLLVAIVLSALPNAMKPLHKHREGHKHAGRYLAEHVAPGDTVIDPFSWAEWYAGRSLRYVPPDPPTAAPGTVRWAVLEPITSENSHSRLPRLPAALAVAGDKGNPPVVAYHWPEDVPVERAKVLVYRQVVK